MSQWKSSADAANSVNYAARLQGGAAGAGSGKTALAANNTAFFGNVTPGSFLSNTVPGQFAFSTAAMANVSGESKKVAHAGWQLRTVGEGPATAATSNASGTSGFSNGETIRLSNGSSNGILVVTANGTGNIVSVAPGGGGVFPNTSVIAYSFIREKHLVANVTVTGSATGAGNSDNNFLTFSNVGIGYGVPATVTVSSNSLAGISNSSTFTITNPGLFANTQTNSAVTFTISNSTGGAITGLTFVANLATSTGGNVSVSAVGGRAGRVQYQTLVAMGTITTGAGANTAGINPQ
jgi:hypothetical protein